MPRTILEYLVYPEDEEWLAVYRILVNMLTVVNIGKLPPTGFCNRHHQHECPTPRDELHSNKVSWQACRRNTGWVSGQCPARLPYWSTTRSEQSVRSWEKGRNWREGFFGCGEVRRTREIVDVECLEGNSSSETWQNMVRSGTNVVKRGRKWFGVIA